MNTTSLNLTLQDFKSVSDHFGTLCIRGLNWWTVFHEVKSCQRILITNHHVCWSLIGNSFINRTFCETQIRNFPKGNGKYFTGSKTTAFYEKSCFVCHGTPLYWTSFSCYFPCQELRIQLLYSFNFISSRHLPAQSYQ